MSKTTPPTIFCEDFALIPRGPHEGKPPVTFSRPVNLLSAASAEGAAATGKAAHVLVLNLDGQLYIRDLGGTAALHWNGNSTTQANLRHGDKVRLGKIEYEVNATRFTTARPETSTGPAAQLVPTAGSAARKVITPVSLIGSSEQAEIRLGGDSVPGALAMILRIGPGYWLWNLEAAFPCQVNGEVVVRVAVGDGSVISVAGQEFRFHIRPEIAARPEAKAPGKRIARTPGSPQRAPKTPAPPKAAAAPLAPPPSAPAPSPEAAAPPIAIPQPVAKPTVVTNPSPTPAAVPAPAIQPRATSQPTPPPAQVAPTADDEADVFKQWGPLAFAVAAADRPELQPVGPSSAAHPSSPERSRPNREGSAFAIRLVAILLLAMVLALSVYWAWKFLIPRHP